MTLIQKLRLWAGFSRAELVGRVGNIKSVDDVKHFESGMKEPTRDQLGAVSEICRLARAKEGLPVHGPGIDENAAPSDDLQKELDAESPPKAPPEEE